MGKDRTYVRQTRDDNSKCDNQAKPELLSKYGRNPSKQKHAWCMDGCDPGYSTCTTV